MFHHPESGHYEGERHAQLKQQSETQRLLPDPAPQQAGTPLAARVGDLLIQAGSSLKARYATNVDQVAGWSNLEQRPADF